MDIKKEIIVIPEPVKIKYYDLLNGDETLETFQNITITVRFSEAIEADIKICGDDEGEYWTEMVLFNNGCEVCCTDIGELEDFFGEWECEYNGTKYIAVIKEC